jgi:RecQ family ATP-dependent DNA helicase
VPPASSDPARLLARVFGHRAFRPGQEAAVSAALARRDALVVMPTGAGKSLCYQLPALGALRFTVVVSPLVALMQDQVASLVRIGRDDVAALSSGNGADEARDVLDRLQAGAVRLLYVAPERFANARFMRAIAAAEIDLLVVDEAHCLSEWGHDFRPDYGRLAAVRHALGDPPTMALTATATPRVALDIARRLRLRDPVEVRTGFDRPNVTFDVLLTSGDRARAEALEAGLAEPGSRPAIVYARSRRAVDEIAERLDCLSYHAGLSPDDRRRTQEEFMASTDAVIACTTAFGMGVDKPDVRSVWHWNLPGSVEAYYQEAGRAGRDGAPARAVLLYAPADRGIIGRFISDARFGATEVEGLLDALAEVTDAETRRFRAMPADLAPGNADAARAWLAAAEAVGAVELEPGSGTVMTGRLNLRRLGNERRLAIDQRARAIERVRWEQLEAIERYAERMTCRRESLLRYFGDREPPRPTGRCCDVHEPPPGAPHRGPWLEPEELIDAVVEIAATAEPSVGRAGLDGIARGLDAYRDRYGEHPLFGVASGLRPPQVRAAIGAAVAREQLASTEGRYPLLLPPGTGPRRAAAGQPGRTRRNPRPAAASDMDMDLLDELRSWRRAEAATRAVPAYVVANDRALAEIATRRPTDAAGLLECSGVGRTFVARYGEAVLQMIATRHTSRAR